MNQQNQDSANAMPPQGAPQQPQQAYPQTPPAAPGYYQQPQYGQPGVVYVQQPVMQQPMMQQPVYMQQPMVQAWQQTPDRNTLATTSRTIGFIGVALWVLLSTANIVTVLVGDYRFERSMLPVSIVLWIATWAVAITAIIMGHIGHSRSNYLNGTGRSAAILGFSLGYGTIFVGLLVSVIINTMKYY